MESTENWEIEGGGTARLMQALLLLLWIDQDYSIAWLCSFDGRIELLKEAVFLLYSLRSFLKTQQVQTTLLS